MRIYTSYFGNKKKLEELGIMPISICLYPPKWFNGIRIKSVAPTSSILFAKNQTTERYVERFKDEVLSKVNPHQLFENLKSICGGKDVALCCFEKPEEFCHRHIVAEWLNKSLGIDVEEFDPNVKEEEKTVVQYDLFGNAEEV